MNICLTLLMTYGSSSSPDVQVFALPVSTATDFYNAPQSYSFVSAVYASAYPSVCASVRHTPVLCQNEGTQSDAVFISGSPISLVFWCQEWLMGDDTVQVKFECKQVDPL